MSQEEPIVFKEYVEDNFEKRWICASSSAARAPVLLMKKADGSLRLCVDYYNRNTITVNNSYPLTLIRETLDLLSIAKGYTKLDLCQRYHQIQEAKGEEWKAAFQTHCKHLEYTVMPFTKTNAPATFQHFVNDCIK